MAMHPLLFLLCVASLLPRAARAYQCDPGKANSSARSPCAGWLNGADTNRTLCEVVLGCCYEVAGDVCFSPVGYKGPTAPLPSIRNTQLKWLGFFGQPASDQSSYDPEAQASFATFGAASDFPTLQQGAALGTYAASLPTATSCEDRGHNRTLNPAGSCAPVLPCSRAPVPPCSRAAVHPCTFASSRVDMRMLWSVCRHGVTF